MPRTKAKTTKTTPKKTVKRTPRARAVRVNTMPAPVRQPDISPRMVGPFRSVANLFRGYFNFLGRSTRSEFWFSNLFWVILIIASMLLFGPRVTSIVSALMCIPMLALFVRRFRDAGVSVWLFIIPCLILYGVPMIYGSKWAGLLMLEYMTPGMLLYSLFVMVFTIFCFVVTVQPSHR